MGNRKFTFNAFLLIVILVSALALFVTVKLTNMADRTSVNEFHPIENTNYAVRYSSLKPNGIYIGDENTGQLVLEGKYGFDWGLTVEDDTIYTNEYTTTDLGMMMSSLVKIEVNSFQKSELYPNTLLRGRCLSGELVCLGDCFLPANYPKTNELCKLYSMTDASLRPESDSATVVFIDPKSAEIVYTVQDEEALSDAFDERYLSRTLEEVKG